MTVAGIASTVAGAPTGASTGTVPNAGGASFATALRSALQQGSAPAATPTADPGGTAASSSGVSAPRPPSITLAAALGLAPVVPVPVDAAGNPLAPAGSTVGTSGPVGEWASRLPAAGRAWADEIEAVATRAGVDPRLLAALVRAESGFRADARSSAGAVGLTQLMPATARGLGVDPSDPLQNLEGGARYLRSMLDRFGSTSLALAAYNAGPGRVERAGGIPAISETRTYVTRVLGFYEQLR